MLHACQRLAVPFLFFLMPKSLASWRIREGVGAALHPSAAVAPGDLPASAEVAAVPRAVYRAPEPPSSRASWQRRDRRV